MSRPRYRLTRHALKDIRDIHSYSKDEWGAKKADAYVSQLYAAMTSISAKPEIGKFRASRSRPFLMMRAQKHFVIYHAADNDVVILTVIHQSRGVERIIAGLKIKFLEEIQSIFS